MNRRDLLTLDFSTHQHQDFSGVARTLSGLAPYAGQWTLAEVKHLLRRAMFGSPKSDADYFVGLGMTNTITELLTAPPTAPASPLWTYDANYSDPNVPDRKSVV